MSMGVYVDTGILVKTYVLEENSPAAVDLVERAGDPLLYSHVHALELENAIRLKRFRGELTPAQERAAIRDFRDDLGSGRLVLPRYDLAAAFRRAERLSERFSGSTGTRSLDLLHVATALEMGCEGFATWDVRQRRVAVRAGLKAFE